MAVYCLFTRFLWYLTQGILILLKLCVKPTIDLPDFPFVEQSQSDLWCPNRLSPKPCILSTKLLGLSEGVLNSLLIVFTFGVDPRYTN